MRAADRTRILAVSGVAFIALAGCSSSPKTAFELMQEQQQLQAQARQAEDDAARRDIPSQPDMFLSLISQSMEQGRYFAALAYVDAYIQKYGETAEVLPLRANALRMTGQESAAEGLYQKLVSTGHAADGWHGLGLLAGARGDFAGAADSLAKASRLKPTDADILSDLGYARLRAGDIAQARLPLGQAAELNPGNTKVIANLALLLLIEGDTERATRVMDQANMSEQARAQLLNLSQTTRASAQAAARQAQAQAMQMQAAQVQYSQALPARAMQAQTAQTADPKQSLQSRSAGDPPVAASPSAGTTRNVVRFVDSGNEAIAVPSARTVTTPVAGTAVADSTDVTAPATASATTAPAASLPAAPREPRVAAMPMPNLGMHAPSMNFLGNTPLVR